MTLDQPKCSNGACAHVSHAHFLAPTAACTSILGGGSQPYWGLGGMADLFPKHGMCDSHIRCDVGCQPDEPVTGTSL